MYVSNDAITVEAIGPVRVARLNRPATGNAVDRDMKICLREIWDALADDLDVGAVVLTGAGKTFSAGGDISDFDYVTKNNEYRRRVRLRHARQILDAMVECPLPIVSAVNGAAFGLGCSIAALGDIILAGESAYFADTHVSIGLVAGDGAVAVWPLLMSLARAKEYLLTGDRISAEEAYRIGLVNHVYPDAELLPRAIELAGRLAAQPRMAVQETKRALNLHIQRAAIGILDMALAAESESFLTDEHHQKVRLFLERKSAKND
jgi:enoyl-CoA hydratase